LKVKVLTFGADSGIANDAAGECSSFLRHE
jgi:hypothetical protein